MIRKLGERFRRNPYPLYSLLRRLRPVLRILRLGHWALFDYASVRRALDDDDTFSSDVSRAGFGTLGWFIFLDPPRHTVLRALVSRAFTPRSVALLESRIRALADTLLDPHRERGTLELIDDFALRLPLVVIAEMIGVPATEWRRFRGWSDAILGLVAAVGGGPRAVAAAATYHRAHQEMRDYLAPLLGTRRTAANDDLLARLVHADVDGVQLTDEEILGFFELLLLAGHETTSNLISNTVVCLLDHPQQLARLRAQPELWPSAIEEVLRYRSPVQAVFRVTRREVKIAGRTLPAGKLVLAMIGAANRDPRQFAHADSFDVARAPNAHVAFGHGIHFCLGASLGRLEARVALPLLFDRLPGLAAAGRRSWVPRPSFHVHGPDRFPVRFDPCGASTDDARERQVHSIPSREPRPTSADG